MSEQTKADALLSNITDEVDEEILSNGAMSLLNLLNPVEKSSNNQHSAQSVNTQPEEQPINTLVFNDQNGAHLDNTCLLNIRATNDSQVKKYRGNECARLMLTS